jgi:hypothetical protein
MKYINLAEGSTAEDLAQVQAVVRSHFSENQGRCPLYGNITGYRFVLSPTESIVLDTDGKGARSILAEVNLDGRQRRPVQELRILSRKGRNESNSHVVEISENCRSRSSSRCHGR